MERIRAVIGTWGIVAIASYIGARIAMYDIYLTEKHLQAMIIDVVVVILIAVIAGLVQYFWKAILDLGQDE